MQKVLSVKKPTSDIVKMMNYVRQECGNDFQNRVPQATQDNIKEFGSGVMNYEPTKNTFVDTLVNVIGRVWIEYHMFTNPLRMLKKGRLELQDPDDARQSGIGAGEADSDTVCFCGSSSVDRASAFQAEGREFEPRLPLKKG